MSLLAVFLYISVILCVQRIPLLKANGLEKERTADQEKTELDHLENKFEEIQNSDDCKL